MLDNRNRKENGFFFFFLIKALRICPILFIIANKVLEVTWWKSAAERSNWKRCTFHSPSSYAWFNVMEGQRGAAVHRTKRPASNHLEYQNGEEPSPTRIQVCSMNKSCIAASLEELVDFCQVIQFNNFAQIPKLLFNLHQSLHVNAYDASANRRTPMPFSRVG